MNYIYAILLLFLCSLSYAQVSGDFNGDIKSSTLAGSGDRNVVADQNGTLKIGSSVSALPSSPSLGEMVYFDGVTWQTVASGVQGQTLTYCNSKPVWGPCPSASITIHTPEQIKDNSAKIRWTTTENVQGYVEYGPTTNYGFQTPGETSFNFRIHLQILTGLQAGTVYFYKVHSITQSGDDITATGSFMTTGSAVQPECSDGLDNDGDSLIDMDDPGCSSATDDSENTQEPLSFASAWTTGADMLRPRGEFPACLVNGKVYLLGGIDANAGGPSQVDVYDPLTDFWSTPTSMPRRRDHFSQAVYGDEIWIVGGKTGNATTGTKLVDVYNTVTGIWSVGPNLPEIHWAGAIAVIGNELHAIGGSSINKFTTTKHHFVLDLSDDSAGWTVETDLPLERTHVAAVAIGDKIYVVGGELTHAHNGDTKTVQIYDTLTDTWSLGEDLTEARSHHEWATFAYNGTIISVSGVDSAFEPGTIGQETIYQYFPDQDSWVTLDDLPRKLVSPASVITNGKLYVFGGGVNRWFDADPITGKKMITVWIRDIL